MLAMCVSMSANCGGTGTTIGTGPNLIMLELILDSFPDCPLSFATWMAFAVPQLIICLIIVWIWLQFYYLPFPWKVSVLLGIFEIISATFYIRFLFRKRKYWLPLLSNCIEFQKVDDKEKEETKKRDLQVKEVLRHHLDELGSMSYEEKTVSCVFVTLVLLWFFRAPGFMTGWGDLLSDRYDTGLSEEIVISDSTAAVIVVCLLFVLPKKVEIINCNS